MPTKKSSPAKAKKSTSRNRQAQLDAESRQRSQNELQDANTLERQRLEANARGAKANADREAAEASLAKEGDEVSIDLERIPNHLQTADMVNRVRGLRNLGAHNKTGRVTRIEQSPEGPMLVVDGPDFTAVVPQGLATKAQASSGKKSASKKSSAKKAAKKSAKKSSK